MTMIRRALCLALMGLAPRLAAEPLTVESAIGAARATSGTLRVKRLEVERTEYALREARTRSMPQLGLTASSTYMTNPPEGITIRQGSFGAAPVPGSEYPVFLPDQDYVLVKDTEPTYFTLTGTLDQVLWTWGKIEKAAKIAELDRAAAEVAVEASARQLDADVARAYFGAVASRDSLELLREAEALAGEMVADRERAFAEGTLVKQDVLEIRSQAAQITAQRVRAEEGLATGLDALELYTGSRPDPASLASGYRDALPEIDEKALVQSALASSTELKTLSLKGRQAELAEELRRASLMGLPDISLRLTLDIKGQEVPFVGGNWTDTWDTNLMLTIAGKVTLFDSLASVWSLKQAQAQSTEAAEGAAELARGMRIQVRRLVDAARTNAALVVQRQAEAEYAAEQARNAAVSYENEIITRGEERGARLQAVVARLTLLLARLQTEYAILDLELLSGASFPRQ